MTKKPKKKKQARSARIMVRLSPEELEALEQSSALLMIPTSAHARRLLLRALADEVIE